MQIKVNKTMDASPDGIKVNTYEAGRVYDLPRGLAVVFISEGWGECDDEQQESPMQDKMIKPSGKKRGRPFKVKNA